MKKIFKSGLTILFCLIMIFNYFFSILAVENIETNEPETTCIETIESNETTESIEEPESDEDESKEEIIEDLIKDIEEPEEDNGDTEDVYEEESEEDVEETGNDSIDESKENEILYPFVTIDEEGNEKIDDIIEQFEDETEEKNEKGKQEDEKSSNKILSEKIKNATSSEIESEIEENVGEEIIDTATFSEIKEIVDEGIIDDATPSEIEENVGEEIIDCATPSETEENVDDKCEVIIYFLTSMKLKDNGNGGSYNYSWDTFIVEKNRKFNIDERIPKVIKHSSCDQEYVLVGFTTENQIDSLWKGADYAGGVPTLDKNFIVDNNMEIFAVYEAKDIYISSIIIDDEISYKTTTIPNKAIKNIYVSDNNNNIYKKNENVKYYKIKNNIDDTNYMFTKDSSEGKPIKAEDFSLKKYK